MPLALVVKPVGLAGFLSFANSKHFKIRLKVLHTTAWGIAPRQNHLQINVPLLSIKLCPKYIKYLGHHKTLRHYTVNHAREWYHLPDMFCTGNPLDGSFYAKPKATMRHTAVFPQIQIPLECLLREIFVDNTFQE